MVSKLIGVTGHRVQRLKGWVKPQEQLNKLALNTLKRSEADRVVSGMALGWDLAMCFAAMELQLPLTAAVPHPGQSSRWGDRYSIKLWERSLEYAHSTDGVITISPQYDTRSLQRRNEWLVDFVDTYSGHIIALYDGVPKGGTYSCIKYINKRQVKMYNVWNSWCKYALKEIH